jgi:sulfofructose kinase
LWDRDERVALAPADLKREWISSARALLADGHDTEAAAAAARWARECGVPVIADVDSIYPGLEKLLEASDYLIASEDFPRRFTGERDLKAGLEVIAKRFGCKLVGATMGAQGAVVISAGRTIHSPGFVVNAVDTTGAGDIFHGAFVYGLLAEWPLKRTLDFSNAAGALNSTAIGARGHIAGLGEIEELMGSGVRSAPWPSKQPGANEGWLELPKGRA